MRVNGRLREWRTSRPLVRRGAGSKPVAQRPETSDWKDLPDVLRFRFNEVIARSGGKSIALVLSPFLACEEAWLLGQPPLQRYLDYMQDTAVGRR